jgi:hypothetical protein
LRILALAVLALALASITSFPSASADAAPSAARTGLRVAVITPEGVDGFVVDDRADGVTVTAAPSNRGENSRLLFWRRGPRVDPGATSCATWSSASSDVVQQGAALRILEGPGGVVRAITVTKNVYVHAHWIFNVHVWGSSRGLGREIASFDLRRAFRSLDAPDDVLPLPWRLCARVHAGRVEFKAWRLAEDEPTWTDPNHGGSVAVPADAPAAGTAGWFVGHLRADMSATFTDLRVHAPAAASEAAVGVSGAGLVPAPAGELHR